MTFRKLVQISRPRFWIYLFGPYIVGLLCGASSPTDLLNGLTILFGLFFTLPANLLVYGINDLFDWQTDVHNPKKNNYETLVTPAEHKDLIQKILAFSTPFYFVALFTIPECWPALLGFTLCALEYSAPPIRAKTKPILDSVFNVLYIFPGVFGYYLAGGTNFSLAPFIAAWLWAMAMHAYSAVPDMTIDRDSSTPTVATLLGFYGTLLFCTALYAASAMIAFHSIGRVAALLGVVYIIMMFLSIRAGEEKEVMRIYKWFPLVNTLCGFVLFWVIALQKFYGLHFF